MKDSDSGSDWSDAEEIEEVESSAQSVHCLFCHLCFGKVDDCFYHIKETHQINLKQIILDFKLDFYGYIKLINYLRKNKPSAQSVSKSDFKDAFSNDEYLQPVLEEDLMLQFDVDDFKENNIVTKELVTDGDINFEEKCSVAEERAKLAEEFLERTIDDLNSCRNDLQNLLMKGNISVDKIEEGSPSNDSPEYFSSYAHHGIHEEMLKDSVRTKAYESFISSNSKVFEGAAVLDVGCGTSILSMFSAKAGAKKVVGVDNSEVVYQAMDIVKENNLEKVITIVKGKAEDLKSPNNKFDVIISEWMGYFLLFESMFDTVIYCRDNYLNPKGRIYPDKCKILLSLLADEELYLEKVNYWSDVYGFKMTTIKRSVLEEPIIEIIDSSKLRSPSVTVKEFDLMSITVADLEFDQFFEVPIETDGIYSSVVGYFDIAFGEGVVEKPVTFSTGPHTAPTHWKQTIFLLEEPFKCKAGDIIRGRIFVKKNKDDKRSLDIAFVFFDENNSVKLRQHYVIS